MVDRLERDVDHAFVLIPLLPKHALTGRLQRQQQAVNQVVGYLTEWALAQV
jgi:hypothetical protein